METKYIALSIFTLFIIGCIIAFIKINKDKTIRGSAIITDGNTVSFFGKEYYCKICPEKWSKNNKLYIRYYGELKEMIYLMYDPLIGYVLTAEDRDNPKFYLIDEVHIGEIGTKVAGYLKNEVFYVIGTVD